MEKTKTKKNNKEFPLVIIDKLIYTLNDLLLENLINQIENFDLFISSPGCKN